MRTPEDTQKTIEDQFNHTLLPNSHSAVEKIIRSTGIKDTLAYTLIDGLLDLGDDVWKKKPATMKKEDFKAIMNVELTKVFNGGEVQNPLLDMPG